MSASACAPTVASLQRRAASVSRRCFRRGSKLERCAARVHGNNSLLANRRGASAARLAVDTPPVSATLRYLTSSWSFKKSRRKGKRMGPTPDRLPPLLTDEGMVQHCRKAENEHAPLIALDVSPSNFGVAISNKRKTRAYPLAVVQRFNPATSQVDSDHVFAKLRHMIEENRACGIVVGWPLERNGIAEHTCVKVLKFLATMKLKGKISLPVALCDERYTTVLATGRLKHVHRIEGDDAVEELVNQTAAMFILTRFLRRCGLLKGAQKYQATNGTTQKKEDRDPSESSL